MGHNFHVFKLEPNGAVELTVTTAGSSVAIPTLANGVKAKFVHLRCHSGAATLITLSPELSATFPTLTNGFPMKITDDVGVIIDVTGFSHIGARAETASDSILNVQPLSNF